MENQKRIPNRLINEKSPYLLQHANNPVQWYPWGEEAFEKARLEDKPIFLSIGYSTCHWCHVMAHESFEDEDVAALLNASFLAIKVDREERPDIDAIYMQVCQAMTGSGGWPLSIFMTAEQKPFLAGTYFPKRTRYQTPGLVEYLKVIRDRWQDDREALLAVGEQMTMYLQQERSSGDQAELSKGVMQKAADYFKQNFDTVYGGFGRNPKFPAAHNLMFLLHYSVLEQDDQALAMVEKTLLQMYQGGLYDQVGFGFSRYSTDQQWLAPHFEKMLYDNALLIIAYLEAYQVTEKAIYKRVAQQTITYVLREMTSDEGGFMSAQDADSEGEEGKYYLFTAAELRDLLGEADGAYFNDYFQVWEQGNFEGKSILNRLGQAVDEFEDQRIAQLLAKVYEYRLKRVALHRDDKILTAWNGLMVVALAKGYQVLKDPVYLAAAQKCVAFIEAKLVKNDGNLSTRYRDGHISDQGFLDDYACLVWALLALYEATFEVRYLRRAILLNEKMLLDFWDEKGGGFYLKAEHDQVLIANPKEWYDGAMPSGNSIAAYNLVRLAKLTGSAALTKAADLQLQAVAAHSDISQGHSFYLLALMQELYQTQEIVAVTMTQRDSEIMIDTLGKGFYPQVTVLLKTPENSREMEEIAPFTAAYQLKTDQATYYLCENHLCAAPVNDLATLFKRIVS